MNSPQPVESTAGKARLLDYLRLFRLPNVFTAMSDIAMGYLVVQHSFLPAPPLLLLLVSSALLYTAGMVLNDLFDVEIDRQERPQRPLPSGRISLGTARCLGFGMLALGLLAGAAAGLLVPQEGHLAWRPAAIAGLLALSVLAYDAGLKRTLLGPLGMGLCRLFNVLLGMSTGMASGSINAMGYEPYQWLIAGGIGVYIVGVTWFARNEAKEQQGAWQLAAGTSVMMTGILLLGFIHRMLPPGAQPVFTSEIYWWLLLGLLGFTIMRRCNLAILDPKPPLIQSAVKHAILSLIVLDAAVTLEFCHPLYAICVLSLLLPTVLLGLWVYST